jgi:hypothetical protein
MRQRHTKPHCMSVATLQLPVVHNDRHGVRIHYQPLDADPLTCGCALSTDPRLAIDVVLM